MRQEKTVLVSEETEGLKHNIKTNQVQKPSRKLIAPRFISPITGMIIDQGTDIVFEGIIDGECIVCASLYLNYIIYI